MQTDTSTTKLKMDISDLKRSITEARRQIRLANAEFKASSAGMDNWSQSADGLSAKMDQLRSTLKAEKSILSDLNKQYELTVQSQGKNSKGAQELLIKIKNQEAAINKTKSSLEKYGRMLSEIDHEVSQAGDGADEMRSAYEKLADTISEQESDLQSLKGKYANVVLEQGKASKEARELANEISQLSGELAESKSKMASAADAADDLDKSLEHVSEEAKDSSEGFSVLKGALADLLADGVKSTINEIKEFATTTSKAYNKFQAQTGASAKEMQTFKKEINELYSNNFGESIEDIGDKMAYVKQVTGETDPSKLKELTKNAITLEDTFGSDFNETIRGVSNLMTHFGLDATTAFDLFAKGSQEGLDYTDELGDNIAEYGGNFEQAGYSAEEYFQLLKNGTQNGAYNLDKVNDSINEVKNRLGDGTIEKSIAIFSKNTQTAFKNWQNGKGTMKDVIESIVSDINGCKNEQEALNMASTAFGTMGEDANLKVVKSLTSTGNAFSNVKGKMQEVKDIRYDDVASKFEELGRKVQTDLIIPLAEKFLPVAEKGIDFLIKHVDAAIPVVATLGTALGGLFTAGKVMGFVNTFSQFTGALGTATGAATATAGATASLGSAMGLLPVALIAAGIAGVTGALVTYGKKQDAAIQGTYENVQTTDKLISKEKELEKALEKSASARQKSIEKTGEEGEEVESYFKRLSELLGVEDKNIVQKKLISDYVEKLNKLIPGLNLKYDEEKDKLNKSTEAIQTNIREQKQLLKAKAARKNLSKIAEDVVKLETQQGELTKQNTKNEKEYHAAKEKAEEAYQKWAASGSRLWGKEYKNYRKLADAEKQKKEAYEETNKALDKTKQKIKELNSEYDKTEKTASTAVDAANTEKALTAITEKMKAKGKQIPAAVAEGIRSGQYEVPSSVEGMENLIKFDNLAKKAKLDGTKIPKSLAEGISNGKISAQDAVKRLSDVVKFNDSSAVAAAKDAGIKIPKSLSEGIASGKVSVEQATKQVRSALSFKAALSDAGITGKQIPKQLSNAVITGKTSIEQATKRVQDAITFKEAAKKAGKDGTLAVDNLITNILSGKTTLKSASSALVKSGASSAEKAAPGYGKSGSKAGHAFSTDLLKTKGSTQSAGKSVAKAGAKSAGGQAAAYNKMGKNNTEQYNKGILSKKGATESATKNVAKKGKAGFGEVSTYGSGQNFAKGFINGIGSLVSAAFDKAYNLARKAWAGLREGQDEGSPSKLTRQSGEYFGQGFVNGIESMTKTVVQSATQMGVQAVQSLRDAQEEGSPSKLTYRSGRYFVQGYIKGIASEEKSLTNTVKQTVKSAMYTLLRMKDFDFSTVSENASSQFSKAISDKVSYMSNKMSYQNDKKMTALENQLSNYESKRDAYQSKYDTAKSKYDKAKSDYKTAIKNYNTAVANYNKSTKESDYKKYDKQIEKYKKQIAANKKIMTTQSKNMSAAKKQLSNYKKLVKNQTAFNNAYQTASSQMLSEFSNALNEYQTKAQALIDDTINGITNTYQTRYDDLISKQDSLISKLKSAGDLFEVSDAGIMTVNDIKAQTQNIKEYAQKLQTIKGKVSSELFDQIANYDMKEGSAFIDRLLEMSSADLKAYSDAYDEKMRVSEALGKQTYKKDFDTVANDYKKSISEAFKDLPKQLEEIGINTMKGFTKGLTKNTNYMDKAVKTMVKAIVDEFKKDLDIHSPSKVTEKLGVFTAQGYGIGLINSIKKVQAQAKSFIDRVTTPIYDISGNVPKVRNAVPRSTGNNISNNNQTIINNYNLTQNNTSPKSLSALETYRARRQQVNMVKAMTQPV